MKFNPFRLIFSLFSIILLSSCLGTTEVTTSTDASFVSLAFKTNDSIPFISTAVFTLVDNTIVNVDSLPYRTRIDSVYPTFSFKTTAGAKLYFPNGYKYKEDSAWITGTDTIDFRQTVRVKNWASDGITHKEYYITTNVHHVDPEVYQWKKVSDNLNSLNTTSQKTVILNDTLFYYSNDGTNAYLYTSTDGYNWKNQSTKVTGLPVNTPLNDMMQFNGKLYLTQDGTNIYSSTDGINWTKKTVTDFTYQSLLYVLNGQLWAVVKWNKDKDNIYRFSNSSDGYYWATDTTRTVPDNFPVKDFASTTYNSTTGKSKVIVLGGHSATGSRLINSWSSEDGVYWVDFSNASTVLNNKTLDTLATGASVIPYDGKLLIFGSRTDNGGSFYKVSKDDGLTWQYPDTLRNVLSSDYLAVPRSYQSVVVFKPKTYATENSAGLKGEIELSNRIFIVGGNLGSTNYSDVYTGKLNRLSFLRQEKTIYQNKYTLKTAN